MKISDITISYNNKTGLIETLESILSQDYYNYEVIVIDGDSTDGSKEILNQYQEKFRQKKIDFSFVSEPDNGIYNAMNKGIAMARGECVVFMNSGDFFASNTIFETISKVDWEENEIVYGDWKKRKNRKISIKQADSIDSILYTMPTRHQSFFFKTSLMKTRNYLEEYKICSDYEWLLHAYLSGKRFLYVPQCICVFDMGGISHSHGYETYCETKEIQKKYNVCKDGNISLQIKKIVWYIITKFRKV